MRIARRLLIAHLACLALLCAAWTATWGPWVAQALGSAMDADVCSVAMSAPASASNAQGDPAANDHAGHGSGLCTLCCSSASAAPGLPASTSPVWPRVELRLWPRLLLVAPRTLPVWAAAQARAPPERA